jgi:hypothetical protein
VSPTPAAPEIARKHAQAFAEFLTLSRERQEHLRRIDRAYREADSAEQARLLQLMQRYTDWLDRLTPEQRDRVQKADSSEQRLQAIKDIKEEQWIATLPKADRDQLQRAKDNPQAYRDAVDKLRREERERNNQWQIMLARMGDREGILRQELLLWRSQILKKFEGPERERREKEWKNINDPLVRKALWEDAQAKGVPVPEPILKLRMNMKPLARVPDFKLSQFMERNEDIRRRFEPRLKDPEQSQQALAELIELYWERNRAEQEAIRAEDAAKRNRTRTGPREMK